MDTLSKIIFDKELQTPIEAKWFNIKDYISYEHDQDCCENCYLDFEHIDLYQNQIENLEEISKIKVIGIKDEWVVVYLYWKKEDYQWERERVWVSLQARNEQNWYYNDEVTIVIKIDWQEYKEDLQDWWFVVNDVY